MDARAALNELAAKVKAEILERLRGPLGVHRKVGENTLIGSNLEKSIDVYVSDDDEIVFIIADYFSFVTGGRHRGLTPRGQNVYGAIQSWVRRKFIRIGNLSETKIIWLVLQKLKTSDIAPRPFIGYDYDYTKYVDEVIPFLNTMIDEWMDNLFDTLMDEAKL